MGRSMRGNASRGTLPSGKISIAALGVEYAVKLDRLARKWGCATLGEAGIELLKDAIDEELRKGVG